MPTFDFSPMFNFAGQGIDAFGNAMSNAYTTQQNRQLAQAAASGNLDAAIQAAGNMGNVDAVLKLVDMKRQLAANQQFGAGYGAVTPMPGAGGTPSAAATPATPATGTQAAAQSTTTPYTGPQMSGLEPNFGKSVGTMLGDLNAKYADQGIGWKVISGYRSNDEQAKLYSAYQNGTGPIAAAPGSSFHNYGGATDIQPYRLDGQPMTWQQRHSLLGQEGPNAAKYGLTWGGAFGDYPHFQAAPHLSQWDNRGWQSSDASAQPQGGSPPVASAPIPPSRPPDLAGTHDLAESQGVPIPPSRPPGLGATPTQAAVQLAGPVPTPDTAPAAPATPQYGTGSIGAGRWAPPGGTPRDVASYIVQAAQQRGIDPSIALRVAQSEGLNKYTGDQSRSFGPFQLFTGGGLGNEFIAKTGLNPADPSTWRQQVDFALDKAAQVGWGPWHGWKGAPFAGIGPNAQPQGVSLAGAAGRALPGSPAIGQTGAMPSFAQPGVPGIGGTTPQAGALSSLLARGAPIINPGAGAVPATLPPAPPGPAQPPSPQGLTMADMLRGQSLTGAPSTFQGNAIPPIGTKGLLVPESPTAAAQPQPAAEPTVTINGKTYTRKQAEEQDKREENADEDEDVGDTPNTEEWDAQRAKDLAATKAKTSPGNAPEAKKGAPAEPAPSFPNAADLARVGPGIGTWAQDFGPGQAAQPRMTATGIPTSGGTPPQPGQQRGLVTNLLSGLLHGIGGAFGGTPAQSRTIPAQLPPTAAGPAPTGQPVIPQPQPAAAPVPSPSGVVAGPGAPTPPQAQTAAPGAPAATPAATSAPQPGTVAAGVAQNPQVAALYQRLEQLTRLLPLAAQTGNPGATAEINAAIQTTRDAITRANQMARPLTPDEAARMPKLDPGDQWWLGGDGKPFPVKSGETVMPVRLSPEAAAKLPPLGPNEQWWQKPGEMPVKVTGVEPDAQILSPAQAAQKGLAPAAPGMTWVFNPSNKNEPYKQVGPPAPLVKIQNEGETKEAATGGELAAKRADALRIQSDQSADKIGRIKLLQTVLNQIDTGNLAPQYANAVGLAKYLGIPDDVISSLGIDPNMATDAGIANKMLGELVKEQIGAKSGGFPASNFSNAEREFIMTMFPSIQNQPGANRAMSEILIAREQRLLDKQDAWDNYRDQQLQMGKSARFDDFEAQYRRQHKGENIFQGVINNFNAGAYKSAKPLTPANPTTIAQAKAAIAAGQDPDAVRKKMVAQGVDPSGI